MGGAETALALLTLAMGLRLTSGRRNRRVVDGDSEDDQEAILSSDSEGDEDEWKPTIIMYAATDNAKICEKTLLAHKACSRPMHVFRDVLERLPAETLRKCKAIEHRKIHAYRKAAALFARAKPNAFRKKIWQAKLDKLKARSGLQLVDELCHVLDTVSFADVAWCLRHEAYCNIAPKAEPELANSLHVEVAWPCCPPWSSMTSTHERWLSTSTLPALVWCFSTRHSEPDGIVHECSLGWDEQPMVKILARGLTPDSVGSPTPKSPFCPSPCPSRYTCMQHHGLCSSLLGFPSRKKRKYTLWTNHPLQLQLPPTMCFMDAFQEIFEHELQCGCSISWKSQHIFALRTWPGKSKLKASSVSPRASCLTTWR